MKLLGANTQPEVMGVDELHGKTNYVIGRDPRKSRANISTYARVEYRAVYPGVDLIYYGNRRQLESDFVVAPGADPSAILLGFEGVDELDIDARGDLVLNAAGAELRLRKPVVYQDDRGKKRIVPGEYVLCGAGCVGFRLRGSSSDVGYDIAVDVVGNVYVTGETMSSDFPVQKPLQQNLAGASDVFITKLDPSNGNIIWSTYLGGSGEDRPSAIGVNSDAPAHVVGTTKSSNSPALNAVPGTFGGGAMDAFVTKLLNIGSGVDYSTYLGGGGGDPFGDDRGLDIAVLDQDAYVAGDTLAPDFPQVGAPLPNTSKNTTDGFLP